MSLWLSVGSSFPDNLRAMKGGGHSISEASSGNRTAIRSAGNAPFNTEDDRT